jgi:antitoxin HicB
MKLNITLKKDQDGFYTASCYSLKGCHSQGRTKAEAVTNIKEAIVGYLASAKKHREP